MTRSAAPEEFIAAYNARDWERLSALLAPACVYEEIGRPQRQVEGVEQITQVFRAWAAAVPEIQGEVRRRVGDDGDVALELDWHGSLAAPFGDFRPAGRPPEVRVAMFFYLDRERIGEIRAYYDSLALYQVLGIMP